MRKNLLLLVMSVILVGTPQFFVFSHEEQSSHGEGAKITGEVVDVVCYLDHGKDGLGAKHADCAKRCIQSGLPVAIKVGGELYIASFKDHTPANQLISEYAGKKVEVNGKILERDGLKLIEIESIQEAK